MFQKLKNITNNNRGFSLIELLVVISIIGILMAVLVANFLGARDRAKDSQRIQDLTSFKSALRLYYNDHQSYPIPVGAITALSGFSPSDQTSLLKYMPGIMGVGFTYYTRDNGENFQICTGLDAGTGGSDLESQVKCGVGTTDVCGLGMNANTGTGNTIPNLYVVCGE